MAAEIKKEHPSAKVEIRVGGRGDFIVKQDGKELWNKRRTHDDAFPEPEEILAQL